MNVWVDKSIKLAKSKKYLDKISTIYPILESEISKKETKKIEKDLYKTFRDLNKISFIEHLLEYRRFPFDDPYIGFLRINRKSLKENPETINRIFYKLIQMGPRKMAEGINRPTSVSRRFGQFFNNWIKSNYKVLDEDAFLKNKKGVVFLYGGDKKMKEFSKKHLGYKRKKGLDFVIKKNNKYIIGETKFVSANGGTQDKSVRELIDFVKKNKSNRFTSLGILDGVPWVSNSTLNKSLGDLKKDEYIISALVLNDFLKDF